MPIENTHKIPKKMWDKWPEESQQVFNDTYSQVKNCQEQVAHPQADVIPLNHWTTLAHNAAWLAAQNVKNIQFKNAKPKSTTKKMPDPDNEYGVPPRVWDEWTTEAKWAFNRLHEFFIRNERDIVVGGYKPVARLCAAMAAELVADKRMLLEEFYFGPKGNRAEQLRRDTREDKNAPKNGGARTGPTKRAQIRKGKISTIRATKKPDRRPSLVAARKPTLKNYRGRKRTARQKAVR